MDASSSTRATPVLDTYQALVTAYTEFLTVAVHTILYERNIYPRESFINARKYNFPVRQNRHPKVCAWIQDAIAAVELEMLKVRTLLLCHFFSFSFLLFVSIWEVVEVYVCVYRDFEASTTNSEVGSNAGQQASKQASKLLFTPQEPWSNTMYY